MVASCLQILAIARRYGIIAGRHLIVQRVSLRFILDPESVERKSLHGLSLLSNTQITPSLSFCVNCELEMGPTLKQQDSLAFDFVINARWMDWSQAHWTCICKFNFATIFTSPIVTTSRSLIADLVKAETLKSSPQQKVEAAVTCHIYPRSNFMSLSHKFV